MMSRIERNRKNKRQKRRLRLFILSIIILFSISIFQVNQSYQNLTGNSQESQMFSLIRDEESIGVVLLGEKLQISMDTIEQGKNALYQMQNKILNLIQDTIEKVSN